MEFVRVHRGVLVRLGISARTQLMPSHNQTAIRYETHSLSHILALIKGGDLVLDPPIQRNVVWSEPKMVGLVDTIARGLPIGSCTVYRETSKDGRVTKDQVIDGQQRLTAIKRFGDGALEFDPEVIARELDLALEGSVNDAQAEWYHHHNWKTLPDEIRKHFGRYELPLVVIEGPAEVAAQTFTRMNQKALPLQPQEIRNAVFKEGGFLKTAQRVCDDFASFFSPPTVCGFIKLQAVSAQGRLRMADIELASQLIILMLDKAQNRRDSIDAFYRSYAAKRGKTHQRREKAANDLVKLLKRVSQLTEGGSLKNLHAGAVGCPVEEQLYALVGALKKSHISGKNFQAFEKEIRRIYAEFQRQVTLYQGDEGDRTGYSVRVREFASTFAGQKNSLPHRKVRIDTLADLFSGIPSMAKGGFSEGQREVLWALAKQKKCARRSSPNCVGKLTYENFQAGHKTHRADGGPATIENGQIECGPCNQGTGDRN